MDTSILDLLGPVLSALTSGNPAVACALALALVIGVTLARKYGAARPVFSFLLNIALWAFEKSSPAIPKAVAAGEAAVKAKPAAGAAGMVGKIRDIE